MKTTFPFRTPAGFFLFSFLLITLQGFAGPLPEQTLAFAVRDSVWGAFRNHFRYHLQAVALSEPRADGSLVLIISEPPPHARIEDLQDLFSGLTVQFVPRRYPIGYDGWVQDVLGVVSNDSGDDQLLDAALLRLHRYLFFTEYKADFLYLERPAVDPEDRNWNLELSATDLRSWLENGEQFTPYTGGEAQLLKPLLDAGATGVYYSLKPGLVAWILPIKKDITAYKKEARVFAIDADLILGSMAGKKSVAILARERRNELSTLPPLRTESILMLASAQTFQLGQSYERNQVFAGKFDGSRDWAPIYLSNELKNGELGSLLNITDQLLKSWSCNGIIRYFNFSDYPKPASWCFAQPLMDELGAGSLTFNWNARGASGSIVDNSTEYYALSRTGALPVSYIPNENNPSPEQKTAVGPYEDKAYACFANWLDPNLVRVVQYTALFQIFRKYEIHADVPKAMPPSDTTLIGEVRAGLDRISAMGKAELESLSRKLAAGHRPVSMPELEHLAEVTKQGIADVRKRFGEPGIGYMIAKIADRNYDADFTGASALIELLNTFYGECHFLLSEMCDRETVKNKLAASFRDAGGPWIKTPSLVVSWAQLPEKKNLLERQVILEGGHNLGMDFPEFIFDPSVPKGEVLAELGHYRNRLHINPADAERLSPRVLRVANRSVNADEMATLAGEIRKELVNTAPRMPYKREEMLPSRTNVVERGYSTQANRMARHDQAKLETLRKAKIEEPGKRSPEGFILQLENGSGIPSQEYAVIREGDQFEIWTLDKTDILSREKGVAARKLIETQQNKRLAELSTKTVLFARADGFTASDEAITLHVGPESFVLPKTDLLQAMDVTASEAPPNVQAFYAFMNSRYPECKELVFQVDEWFDGMGLHDDNGAVPLVRDVLPGTDFINPHRLASLLARYRPASQNTRKGGLHIGLCRSNLAKALDNVNQLPVVKGVKDVGLVIQADQYLSADQMVVANLVSEFKKVDGQVFNLGDGLLFEGRHFILVTGVKSEAYRQQLTEAARKGQLRGKSLILASCYEKFDQNELEFNSKVLLGEGGARGVYLYDSRINLQLLRYVLLEFFKGLNQTKKANNINELFYRSIEAASQSKAALKIEFEQFWKGIFQYSAREEDQLDVDGVSG